MCEYSNQNCNNCLCNIHHGAIMANHQLKNKKLKSIIRSKIMNKINKNVNNNLKSDMLAVSTQYTWKIFQCIQKLTDKLQSSIGYRILTRTTQPAHIIAICFTSFITYSIWPFFIGNDKELLNHSNQNNNQHNRFVNNTKFISTIIYLSSFAIHFGSQIWMTFVSGLSLYFSLPRHTFGKCQQILFPKYFTLNAVLSTCTLITFINLINKSSSVNKNDSETHPKWSSSIIIQIINLCLCSTIEFMIRLYFTSPLIRLIVKKQIMEQSVGNGQEIGQLNEHPLINDPHYIKVHKSFRKLHISIAIGNIITIVSSFIHLLYLTTKIIL